MRAGGGKGKGSGFEREVCVLLSLWVSHGKRKDLFWRSAMSGGRATVHRKGGVRLSAQAGDITAIDPLGNLITDHYTIECKFYKDLDIKAAMLTGKGKLAAFWEQAVRDAAAHGKQPMLIAKQNMIPTMLLLRRFWDKDVINRYETPHERLLVDDIRPKATLHELDGEPGVYFFHDVMASKCPAY